MWDALFHRPVFPVAALKPLTNRYTQVAMRGDTPVRRTRFVEERAKHTDECTRYVVVSRQVGADFADQISTPGIVQHSPISSLEVSLRLKVGEKVVCSRTRQKFIDCDEAAVLEFRAKVQHAV